MVCVTYFWFPFCNLISIKSTLSFLKFPFPIFFWKNFTVLNWNCDESIYMLMFATDVIQLRNVWWFYCGLLKHIALSVLVLHNIYFDFFSDLFLVVVVFHFMTVKNSRNGAQYDITSINGTWKAAEYVVGIRFVHWSARMPKKCILPFWHVVAISCK